MAFVNEYISEADVKKYHVKEAWREISSGYGGNDYFPSKFTWTIDKERNVYFIPMRTGKEEFSNQKVCAFWLGGALLQINLAKIDGELDYANSKGYVLWGLINIYKPINFMVAEDEIISVLKEALIIFGYDGILIPINDYKVSFAF